MEEIIKDENKSRVKQNNWMPKQEDYKLKRRRYTQISVKKRLEIVRLVDAQGRTYSDIARKLHINASTVRLIIKKYQKTGTIFMKKMRNATKNCNQSVLQLESQVNVKIEQAQLANPIVKIEQSIVQDNSQGNQHSKKQECNQIYPYYPQFNNKY